MNVWPSTISYFRRLRGKSRQLLPRSPAISEMGRSYEEYAREKAEREWKDKVKKRKETMSPQQVLDTVTKWKDIGNKKLTAGNLGEAESYYKEALESDCPAVFSSHVLSWSSDI